MSVRDNCKFCTDPPALLQQKFKADIHDQGEELDPDQEQDWFSITLGYAVGNGLTPDEAHEFAIHIRYHTELG